MLSYNNFLSGKLDTILIKNNVKIAFKTYNNSIKIISNKIEKLINKPSVNFNR